MKAMVYPKYGSSDVLQMQETDLPAIGEDHVCVRVHSAPVNRLDVRFLTGRLFMARLMAGGLGRPKNRVLGVDLAGTVDAVGSKTGHFQPGDEVFGSIRRRCFVEYVCVREGELPLKPANQSFEEAAAVGAAASTTLHGQRDAAKIRSGQSVTVNSASRGAGTFAVQIAKSYGTEVTANCGTRNLAWCPQSAPIMRLISHGRISPSAMMGTI
jgi:NADPH:quinone reductase-like Zn-dependent oxidoreductase